jgi:DNA invertase Pin-like site-specific DNA recombinase
VSWPLLSQISQMSQVELVDQLSNQLSTLLSLVNEVEKADWPARSVQTNCKSGPLLHQAQKRLDPEQIARLIADYEAGEPVNGLAVTYGLNRSTVLNHLKRQGVPRRRSRLTISDVEKIVGLYAYGESAEAIALELRIGATTVRRALVKAGVELQRRGRRRSP